MTSLVVLADNEGGVNGDDVDASGVNGGVFIASAVAPSVTIVGLEAVGVDAEVDARETSGYQPSDRKGRYMRTVRAQVLLESRQRCEVVCARHVGGVCSFAIVVLVEELVDKVDAPEVAWRVDCL